jgi:siroheme synthase-like protein
VARRAFLPQDLRASWLVIAATDDEAVNRRISALCRRRRIWVNVADRPALCGFILPSVVRRGGLTFAVSTGGASPALAKFVGRRLKQQFGPEYAALTARLRQQRPSLLKLPMPERKKLLRELFAGSLRRRGNGRALKTEPGRRG